MDKILQPRIARAAADFIGTDMKAAGRALCELGAIAHAGTPTAVSIAKFPGLIDAAAERILTEADYGKAISLSLLATLCRFGASTAITESHPRLIPTLETLPHYDPPRPAPLTPAKKIPGQQNG